MNYVNFLSVVSTNQTFCTVKSMKFKFKFCLKFCNLIPMLSGFSRKQWRNLFDRSALYALFFHSIMAKLTPFFELLINLTPGN